MRAGSHRDVHGNVAAHTGDRCIPMAGMHVGDHYSVQFRTTGFDPDINGGPQAHHVHFFFDSVPQELAGTNDPRNTGDWVLYDKPNPFTKYKLTDRAAHRGASKMCILVANNLHQIELGSGNCVALPSS